MKDFNVPIQSLIDHIKTATDVDPWAKEMAEELLTEQESVEHACDILRANGWKETEPLCSECDAVHVVRCKDCKHLGYTNSHWFCKWQNRCVDEDWFCADGEKVRERSGNGTNH